MAHKNQAYEQNKFRDTNCDVTDSEYTPGLTTHNYLQNSEPPCYMNPWFLAISFILQFDVLFVCILRAKIPMRRLPVTKCVSLEPVIQVQVQVQQQIQQQEQQVQQQMQQQQMQQQQQQKPSYVTDLSAIMIPPLLQENKEPLYIETAITLPADLQNNNYTNGNILAQRIEIPMASDVMQSQIM